jgi:hypothetical protein
MCGREMSDAYKTLMGEADGKRRLGRPRHKWEGNIKLDWRKMWWECVDWICLVKDRDHSGLM